MFCRAELKSLRVPPAVDSDRETLEQLRIIAEYRRRKAEIKAQFQATRKCVPPGCL